jgi:PAS domain S-box-containing protein
LVERNVTPLWPPTGIAVAAFLIWGRFVWPGVALAALAVNLPISTNFLAAAATAVGNTLAPLVAATLLARVGFHRQMDRLRDAMAIVFLGALASMLISASVGAWTLVLSGSIPARMFPAAWAVWWTGDAMGVLVVTPVLLTLWRPRSGGSTSRRLEAIALFVLLTVLSLWVMNTRLQLMFLVVPFLGWAAWRFQQRGAAPAALLVAGIASWSAAHGMGTFRTGTLFEKMVTLQAFNATVAFSSSVFAALVSERARDREALETSAAELEARVQRRTSELSAANEQLHRDIVERIETSRKLRQQETALAEAQQVGQIGSWEWLIPENRVVWSDEMYRIHGYRPQEFPLTFERAVELVVEEDLARIRTNMEVALGSGRDMDLPSIEYRIVRPDGEERRLLGVARLRVGADGAPVRMVGTVQDVTEERKAEREHRIAETLQRSFLPDRLPEIPGVALAARYVPASSDMEVGGDWYDVIPLPSGQIGLAIGDVAGHGLRAASTMGQLRMALRAYAFEEGSPTRVVARVRHLVRQSPAPEMATLIYLLYDPESGIIRFANAGHPPPLIVSEAAGAAYLEGALSPPLGTLADPGGIIEVTRELPFGSTLLLYTDGLVEHRGSSIRDGLDRLKAMAAQAPKDPESLCDHLLSSMVGDQGADDIALLVVKPEPLAGAPLRLLLPAEPSVLAPLRQTVRRWLREIGAPPGVANEILVACGEACANVIQHAYGGREGVLDVELSVLDGTVEVIVRDEGSWRPSVGTDRGRGQQLMGGFMDTVSVETNRHGSSVRMRRRVGSGAHR